MKKPLQKRFLPVGAGLALTILLTACPIMPPPPPPGVSLTFSYPDRADTSGLTLAAFYFVSPGKVRLVGYGGYGTGSSGYSAPSAQTLRPATSPVMPAPANASTSLYLDGYSLQSVLTGPTDRCQSFQDDAVAGMQQITVTPSDVKTCYVYFVAFRDANGDRLPQTSEEVYMTHDVLANASSDFTYSAVSADGRSRESGSLNKGWTLVHHTVLQPSAAPGQYLVSMNSVPASDQGVAIALHEPSAYLTSMGLTSMNLKATGGAK